MHGKYDHDTFVLFIWIGQEPIVSVTGSVKELGAKGRKEDGDGYQIMFHGKIKLYFLVLSGYIIHVRQTKRLILVSWII